MAHSSRTLPRAEMCPTASDMLTSLPGLLPAIRLWALKAKPMNVHIDRDLAAMKKSLSGLLRDSPDVERLVSSVLLGQLLTASTTHGSRDARFVTRSELVELGAPLRVAAAKPSQKSKPSSGFVAFTLKLSSERKAALGKPSTLEETTA